MSLRHDLTSELLAGGPFARTAAPYRLLQVHGPDAVDFLQRLCSQDVAGLGPGGLQPAAFLDAKGKLQATCLVARLDSGLWLECQAHQQPRLHELLERYHFAERLTIVAVASTCSERVGAAGAGDAPAVAGAGPTGRLELRYARRGIAFARQHALDGGSPQPFGGAPLDGERAECLRMLAGLVQVGVESEPTTLALEADLDDHLSTTKGCYTGQEIVARIHTYGHTNRALCLLRLGRGPAITAPQTLHEPADRLAVGRVLHAVPVPGGAQRLGLGYLPRDFQAPGTRLLLEDGGEVTVVGSGGAG